MKDEEKIKEIALQIIELEKQCQLKNNIQESMSKIEQLIQKYDLSLEDLLEVDTYIQEQNFLTK